MPKKHLFKFAVVVATVLGNTQTAWSHGKDETAAFGEEGQPDKATRTVQVEMGDDMHFRPAHLQVRQGETVRFVAHNAGRLRHEFVLGTAESLAEHYELMKKNPEMEHADPNAITVDPGKTGEVVWHFTKAMTVRIGCLQPGHYEAGMKGDIRVGRADSHRPAKARALEHPQ